MSNRIFARIASSLLAAGMIAGAFTTSATTVHAAGSAAAQTTAAAAQTTTDSKTAQTTDATKAATRFATTSVNVRKGPGTNYDIVRTVSRGTKVCVVSTTNGWSLLEDGTYINANYLTDTRSNAVYNWTSVQHDESYYEYALVTKDGPGAWFMDADNCQAEVDNGYLSDYIYTEAGTHFYAVESRTSMGKAVQNLQVGDLVTIDGVTIMIDGAVYGNYNTGNANSMWAEAGYQTGIQTCIPPYHGPIVFKYGHPVETEE